ncbi:MAG TPA: hypothetical protein VGR91_16500 [Stellaceae bacterium]|nr:hypothetical protein [Stellaceae bacterium]
MSGAPRFYVNKVLQVTRNGAPAAWIVIEGPFAALAAAQASAGYWRRRHPEWFLVAGEMIPQTVGE